MDCADNLWAILVKAEVRKLARRGVKFSKALTLWAGWDGCLKSDDMTYKEYKHWRDKQARHVMSKV